MEYFVTGATGFIGSRLVEALVDRGDDVVALVRDRPRARRTLPDAVALVEGDVTDPGSLRPGMAGVDGVFHLAAWFDIGDGPWAAETAERVNVEGTRTVLELVDDLDVPRAVYTSTVGVNGDTGGEYADESYRHDGEHLSVYDRTKHRAHHGVVRPMAAEGVPVVTVLPGLVYGPGDAGAVGSMWRRYLRGRPLVVPRETAASWDHVEDAVDAHLAAMDRGTPGEEYVVCGPGHTFVEAFEVAASITGIPAPPSVSPLPFRLLAPVVEALEPAVRLPEMLRSERLYRMAGTTWLGDATKARRELGIEHRSLRAGLREYLTREAVRLDAAGPSP